jgi:hypothetical protein
LNKKENKASCKSPHRSQRKQILTFFYSYKAQLENKQNQLDKQIEKFNEFEVNASHKLESLDIELRQQQQYVKKLQSQVCFRIAHHYSSLLAKSTP